MTLTQITGLGIALSMDAAAVSMTNGLSEHRMHSKKTFLIALTFGFFQGAMPMVAYLAGSVFLKFFVNITPYLALVLLTFIGVKMIVDGAKQDCSSEAVCLTRKVLLAQAAATSIDALAVGLIFTGLSFANAAAGFFLIAVITFFICLLSVRLGKRFAKVFSGKAQLAGGIILIIIGVKIFTDYMLTLF